MYLPCDLLVSDASQVAQGWDRMYPLTPVTRTSPPGGTIVIVNMGFVVDSAQECSIEIQ